MTYVTYVNVCILSRVFRYVLETQCRFVSIQLPAQLLYALKQQRALIDAQKATLIDRAKHAWKKLLLFSKLLRPQRIQVLQRI